jgi:hypothetical protein
VPDDSTDAKGLEPVIKAGGTNTSEVLIIGTDYAGAVQREIVTLTSAVYASCVNAYRTVTQICIGADGIAFNAGVTSQYTSAAPATKHRVVRGMASTAQAIIGEPVVIMLYDKVGTINTQNASRQIYVGRFTTGGGAAAEDFTIPGVASGDSIVAFLNTEGAAPTTITKADYQAANTVRVTFAADPSTDHQITIMVYR